MCSRRAQHVEDGEGRIQTWGHGALCQDTPCVVSSYFAMPYADPPKVRICQDLEGYFIQNTDNFIKALAKLVDPFNPCLLYGADAQLTGQRYTLTDREFLALFVEFPIEPSTYKFMAAHLSGLVPALEQDGSEYQDGQAGIEGSSGDSNDERMQVDEPETETVAQDDSSRK